MLCRKFPVLSCSYAYFEEGSICLIYNKECSCSDFSSHPLPKPEFPCFLQQQDVCGVQFLNLAMKLSTTFQISRRFLKLPMQLSTGCLHFCPSCHLGLFVEWFEPTYPRRRQMPQREDILLLWKRNPCLVSRCHRGDVASPCADAHFNIEDAAQRIFVRIKCITCAHQLTLMCPYENFFFRSSATL